MALDFFAGCVGGKKKTYLSQKMCKYCPLLNVLIFGVEVSSINAFLNIE
jgi:hypothetical protein